MSVAAVVTAAAFVNLVNTGPPDQRPGSRAALHRRVRRKAQTNMRQMQ
jgi:hypothetical protein